MQKKGQKLPKNQIKIYSIFMRNWKSRKKGRKQCNNFRKQNNNKKGRKGQNKSIGERNSNKREKGKESRRNKEK